MRRIAIVARAQWDPDAEVWVATSDDVPGLATEAETMPELVAKLQVMIPELLELNDGLSDEVPDELPLYVVSEQVAKVRTRAA